MPRCNCWTIARMRETYQLGCTPFVTQVLNASWRGPWYAGTLLGIDGTVADVVLDRKKDAPIRLGTLWPDRLAMVAMGKVRRSRAGLPRVRWNRASRVLELYGPRPRYPAFSVVDLERWPEWLDEVSRLPASCEHLERAEERRLERQRAKAG